MDASNLVWSIKNGDLDAVKEIIEKSNININNLYDGRHLIHFGSDYGHNDIIEYLIQKGADVNANDKHSISPLLAAIWEGHTDCVRTLIDNGANIDGVTPDGKSYVDVAEKDEIKSLLTAATKLNRLKLNN